MISLITALVFAGALIIQTTVMKMYGTNAPDIALLMAIYCGLRYMKANGFQIGIAAGLMQDILSFGITGINMLSKGLTGFASGWLRESHVINSNSPTTWIILITLGTSVNNIIHHIYVAGFFGTPLGFTATAWSILMQILLNILVGIPAFYLFDKLQEELKSLLGIRDF